MSLSGQIARHFREAHFGENWTDSSLRELLRDVDWKKAVDRVDSFNTIAQLVFHMNYYIAALIQVLESSVLDARDKDSFDCPEINSREDWDRLLDKTWKDAEKFAGLIEKLPDDKLWEAMPDKKYGSLYRNCQGTIEHFHYHLGQIALIKKITGN